MRYYVITLNALDFKANFVKVYSWS